MNALGTIKVLLVAVAFENRVNTHANSIKEESGASTSVAPLTASLIGSL